MANDFKLVEGPGCFSSTENIHAFPCKPTTTKLPNDLPSFEPSINKAFNAVCFCCLATDVPLTNAKNCSHKEFVDVYLSMVPSIPLSICNICHHMLKKIEAFKLQIQTNFRNFVLKKPPDNRCIFVNDLSRKLTISIVSLKPISFISKDPLSVSTMHSEVDHHESFADDHVDDDHFEDNVDNLGSSGIWGEEPIIKTEPNEAMNPMVSQDTNIPHDDTQYYIELTPTHVKEEMLPPEPTSTYKQPILQKTLGKSTFTENNDSILTNSLKNDSKRIKVSSITSKKPLFCPKPDATKQNTEKKN